MRRIYLLLICALTASMMTAAQFSQEKAINTAQQFVKQKVGRIARIYEW